MTESTEESKKKGSKKIVTLLIALLVVLAGAFAIIFFVFRSKAEEGAKQLTLVVIDNNQEQKTYEWRTDAKYLLPALQELKDFSIDGADSEYGMMVETVNGLRADYNLDGAYWAIYVNDAWCDYGVDMQPVYDQDVFKIEYTDASEGAY